MIFIDFYRKLHGCVSVWKRFESVRVYDAFVEDESVEFGACDDLEMFGGWVSVEEVGVDDGDVASSTVLERLFEFVEILSHDVIIELSGSSYIE